MPSSRLPPEDLDALAVEAAHIVLAAGPAIMEVYASQTEAREKSDGSPVTQADERAEAIIHDRLRAIDPRPHRRGGSFAAGGANATAGRSSSSIRSTAPANSSPATANYDQHRPHRDGAPVAGAVYAPALAASGSPAKRLCRADAVGAPCPKPANVVV